MSSAFYPLGMSSFNNRTPQGGYKTWKGKGIFSNPVGITSGSMRPLTNRDPRNNALYAFGTARPIKHYRKGIAIPIPVPIPVPDPISIDNIDINLENYDNEVTYYYSNRAVSSSVQNYMVAQMQDRPGGFIVKNNTLENNGINGQIEDCKSCKGIGIVSSWYPINNLSEKPEPVVTNPLLCCNQEKKARRRVMPASTLTNRSYYTTNKQYLYNRCNTYVQKSFAYLTYVNAKDPSGCGYVINASANAIKPGSPLSYLNEYGANCNCNFRIEEAAAQTLFILFAQVLVARGILPESILTNPNINTLRTLIEVIKTLDVESQTKAEFLLLGIINTNNNSNNGAFIEGPGEGVRKGCARVYYKPNNYQFAQEGGVDSSTRTLKKKVTTIELNAAQLNGSRFTELYKQKAASCNPSVYWTDGNPKICFKNNNDANSQNSKYQPNYKVLNLNAQSSVYI